MASQIFKSGSVDVTFGLIKAAGALQQLSHIWQQLPPELQHMLIGGGVGAGAGAMVGHPIAGAAVGAGGGLALAQPFIQQLLTGGGVHGGKLPTLPSSLGPDQTRPPLGSDGSAPGFGTLPAMNEGGMEMPGMPSNHFDPTKFAAAKSAEDVALLEVMRFMRN